MDAGTGADVRKWKLMPRVMAAEVRGSGGSTSSGVWGAAGKTGPRYRIYSINFLIWRSVGERVGLCMRF